jgi:hypothetical protein
MCKFSFIYISAFSRTLHWLVISPTLRYFIKIHNANVVLPSVLWFSMCSATIRCSDYNAVGNKYRTKDAANSDT